MGLSLKERYQEEALKEGKKIVASTWPLARDLREVERWGSKKNGLGLGWDTFFLKELQEEEEEEDFPLYRNLNGSHNLKV